MMKPLYFLMFMAVAMLANEAIAQPPPIVTIPFTTKACFAEIDIDSEAVANEKCDDEIADYIQELDDDPNWEVWDEGTPMTLLNGPIAAPLFWRTKKKQNIVVFWLGSGPPPIGF